MLRVRRKLRGLLVGGLFLAGASPQPAVAAAAAVLIVQGRVEDEAGRPLSGAALRLYATIGQREAGALQLAGRFPPPPLAEAKSDGTGSYRLDVPGPGVYRLVASAEGKAPRQMLLQPLVEESWLPAATLAADAAITVTVVDAAGKPVAGAAVVAQTQRGTARALGGWELASALTVTDAHGVAAVHRRSGERLDVSAAGAGLALAEAKGVGVSSVRLELVSGSSRQLLVVTGDGRPAADAALMVAGSGLPLARSDNAGRATIATRGRDPLALQVEGAAGERARVTLLPPDPHEQPRPLRVELERTTRLHGRVIDAESRQPLAGAVVVLQALPERHAVTDGAGSYTVEGVAARGHAWLLVGAAAHFRADVDVAEAQSVAGVAPTAALAPAGALLGSVSDPRGRPLADVEVSAAPAPERPGMGSRWSFFGQGQTRSDTRGRFRLSPLSTEGRLRVV
ncbi:MAG TPA: carboxypeptidase regulatory-like domain-containing protein, partial [Thermoanaerobaculia bacterium]|nr:carboxypeptidase regulatory-like domain-containing protein [Thermoanaerobaculia bacterium]